MVWNKMNRSESPLARYTSKEEFSADMIDMLDQDYRQNKMIKEIIEDNHEEEEMIAKARREIALQL
jgi:ubiquitin C-terminal hydrolase